MKFAIVALSTAIAVSICAPAQAQIKAGIPPKTKAMRQAEAAAKVEREQQKMAAAAARTRHDASFAKLDANGDGMVSAEEYRAAGAIQEALEDHRKTETR